MTWEDGTVGYGTKYFNRQLPPGCGYGSTGHEMFTVYGCKDQSLHHIICETEAKKEEEASGDESRPTNNTTTNTSSKRRQQRTVTWSTFGLSSHDPQLSKDQPPPPPPPRFRFQQISAVGCADGHFTHSFLACGSRTARNDDDDDDDDDDDSCWRTTRIDNSRDFLFHQGGALWDGPASYSCDASASGPASGSASGAAAELTSLPPMFACGEGGGGVVQLLAYTLVCDFRADCFRGMDEEFCVYAPCVGTFRPCGSGPQCYTTDQRCDGVEDCINGVDEHTCKPDIDAKHNSLTPVEPLPPPAVVNFNGRGNFKVTPLTNGTAAVCPETHFQCADNGYCLPVYTRCNGVADCPGHEDEARCDSFTCPGFYRCRDSQVCLHPSQVCDGWPQCRQRDDELLCNLTCPRPCTCQGLAFTCASVFPSHLHPQLRYLDAGGSDYSGATLRKLRDNVMLVHLGLRGCRLPHLAHLTFPNLRSADLRDNLIRRVAYEDLSEVRNLRTLRLAGNPLTSVFGSGQGREVLESLLSLDLSGVVMPTMDPNSLAGLPNLRHLNLSRCGVHHVSGEGFRPLKTLRVLDLSGCDVREFSRSVFQGMAALREVLADNYKLCCPATLPVGFDVAACRAPFDELTSCDSLLRSSAYRVSLMGFAALGFLGNVGSLVARGLVRKGSGSRSGFSVLVSYLSVADLLMGLYLIVIGVADRVYQDRYLWMERAWRESAACKMAGFLSFASNEVSATIICLITVDRFLVLRFPFSQIRFRRGSAHLASLAAFLLGFLLAAVPWLPGHGHWRFYSRNGICIPLPITRGGFPGHAYSFGVMIVLNLALFMLIAAGQAFIYVSIRSNAIADGDAGAGAVRRKSQDQRIAQRLLSIAVSDFLCWFPIGLLGILASCDVSVPEEVNVGVAIFVLPLNSALNPFLYTLNTLLEQLGRRREDALLLLLETQADDV